MYVSIDSFRFRAAFWLFGLKSDALVPQERLRSRSSIQPVQTLSCVPVLIPLTHTLRNVMQNACCSSCILKTTSASPTSRCSASFASFTCRLEFQPNNTLGLRLRARKKTRERGRDWGGEKTKTYVGFAYRMRVLTARNPCARSYVRRVQMQTCQECV